MQTCGEKATSFQGTQTTSQIASYDWQKEGNNHDNDNSFTLKHYRKDTQNELEFQAS